jgi:stage V sporulation protein D (sporulation-specific penicillin-binding protein)
MSLQEAKNTLFRSGLSIAVESGGEAVERQMPPCGEEVNKGTKILVYLK